MELSERHFVYFIVVQCDTAFIYVRLSAAYYPLMCLNLCDISVL